jgi:large subunit ribosomal protein L35Ae
MNGILENYRRGRNTAHSNQFIVKAEGIDSKAKACSLVGKKVIWKSTTAKSIGKVIAAHGDKGAIRVSFPKGLPGQAISTKVEIQ